MKNSASLTTIQNVVALSVCIRKKSALLNMLINSAGVYSKQYSILSIIKFIFLCYFQMLEYLFVLSKLKLITCDKRHRKYVTI